MAQDLTESLHERQNILNNRYVLEQAEQHLELGGTLYDGDIVFTKQQVIALYDISERTIERGTEKQWISNIKRNETQRVQRLSSWYRHS